MKFLFLTLVIALGIGNIAYAGESVQKMINALQSKEVKEITGDRGEVIVVTQSSGEVSISLSNGLSDYPNSGGMQMFCLTFERNGEVSKEKNICYGH